MQKAVTQIAKIAKGGLFIVVTLALVFGGGLPQNTVHASTVSISINQEPNMVMIPSETRRVYASVTNGTLNTITWSVSGGASIVGGPFTSGWVDVQAPSTGANCTYSGSSPNYVVSSSTQITITATSDDDNTKTASLTVSICNPTVSVNVVPGYRVLYSGQKADLQSFILGNVNTNVNWSIISSPNGGDGTLVDSVNRDTVFSATVAGRYTVRATSAADNTKTATSTLYVTGNTMPYTVTANGTEPIDCSVDPNSTGTVYDVGPARSYTTIGAVPWDTLTPGSTVRIHNDDLTGSSPTTYHEYFNIKTAATQTNPVRVVGCPDSQGNLPIIDGINATSTTNPNPFLVGNEGIGIWESNYDSFGTASLKPNYISIEGLSIRNFNDLNNYYLPNSSTLYEWGQPEGGGQNGADSAFVAAIRNQNGDNVNIDGNEIATNGIGVFTEAQAPEGRMSRWLLVEGNNLHGNVKGKNLSETGSIHTLYIQTFGEVIQGNFAGDADPTGSGGDLKDRGAYTFVRYNTLSGEDDNTGRTIDAVDQQDAAPYVDVNDYLNEYLGGNPVDNAMTINYLSSWVAAWHNYYIYGNVIASHVLSPVHYNADHDEQYGVVPRFGTLWYWGNTGYENGTSLNYDSKWFDTANADLETQQSEFQQVQSYNNIIWMDGTTTTTNPFFTFSRNRAIFLNQQGTITPSTCCTNNQVTGGSGSGWSLSQPETDYFTGADNISSHLQGFGATGTSIPNTVSTRPFDVNTYVPTVGSNAVSLPAQMANLPLRFQPGVTSGIMAPRNDSGSSIGAVSASSLQSNPPGAPTGVVATAGNAQASVAFTAPSSNGGATITGYTVTSSPGGLTATGATSPIVVTGLTNGTPYTFTVTATNTNGTGSASSPSSAVTPSTGATFPGAPTGATATAGNTTASVTFTAPGSNGGATITGYTVISNPAGGTDSNAGSTSLTHSVTGLTNGVAYTFTVTATNSIGTGSASSASNSVTPATVPGAPTSVVATPGNAQASVTFVAPASNGGSAITGYTVTSNPAGGVDSNAGSTALTHTITGLTNSTAYTFTVIAANAKGNSSASSASSAVTPTISGQAPIISNVQVSAVALDNATITWTTDTASTSQVFYGPTNTYGASTTLADAGGVTVHNVVVSGLSASTLYHFKVESTDLNSLTTDSSDQNFTTSAPVVSGGGGGGGGGGGPPTGILFGTLPSSPLSPTVPVVLPANRFLVNDQGTIYLIQNNQKIGIPSVAVLQSNGFTLAQATVATSAQHALPVGPLLTLRDGTLVKTAADPTVYLVSNQQRHAFISGSVFNAQGYTFNTVLTVSPSEANVLPAGPTIASAEIPHSKGVNVNNNGTIYWIGGAAQIHAYTSASVYNEWNVPNDFSGVVPANAADKALTVGTPVLK